MIYEGEKAMCSVKLSLSGSIAWLYVCLLHKSFVLSQLHSKSFHLQLSLDQCQTCIGGTYSGSLC